MLRVIITGRNSTVPHHPFTSSGVQPAARAAGDLPCFVGPKTHTVLRSVPGLSASHSPAVTLPPTTPPGTLADRIIDAVTVLGGLAVFFMIAMFFMVLA